MEQCQEPWHDTQSVQGCQIYPHIHCPSEIKSPVRTLLCVRCEKHSIRTAWRGRIITVAVVLLHKTLYLFLENNKERQEKKKKRQEKKKGIKYSWKLEGLISPVLFSVLMSNPHCNMIAGKIFCSCSPASPTVPNAISAADSRLSPVEPPDMFNCSHPVFLAFMQKFFTIGS